MLKKQTGFTLIELLVVIAIIGILAGILVVAIDPRAQTDKANNAAIMAAMNGVRTQAALYFSENNNTFAGFTGGNVFTNLELESEGAAFRQINAVETAWAASARLYDRGGVAAVFYCVDSTGFAGENALIINASRLTCHPQI